MRDFNEVLEEIKASLHNKVHPSQDYNDEHGLIFSSFAPERKLFMITATDEYVYEFEKKRKYKSVAVQCPDCGKKFKKRIYEGVEEKYKCISQNTEKEPPEVLELWNNNFHTLNDLIEVSEHKKGANGAVEIELVSLILRKYVELPNEALYDIIALWILGTVMTPLFNAYPYLWFIGLPRSGKSKILTLISILSWKGMYWTQPSVSSLFRTIEIEKPTLCMDEAVNLSEYNEMVGVLNSGYKKGAVVPRVDKNTGEVHYFDPYCPKVIAGHEKMTETLIDRSIVIKMEIAEDKEVADRWPTPDDKIEFGDGAASHFLRDIRKKLILWTLKNQKEVLKAMRDTSMVSTLSGRDREIFLPLFALARCGNPSFIPKLEEFARNYISEREASFTSLLEALLLSFFYEEKDTTRFNGGYILKELVSAMNERAAKKVPWQRVVHALDVLGVVKKKVKTSNGVKYYIDKEIVEKKAEKMGITVEEEREEPEEETEAEEEREPVDYAICEVCDRRTFVDAEGRCEGCRNVR